MANKIPVESIKHSDKRANIPTKELSDFVEDDEKKPKTILYPRDPSLDPQLVWKGKDEQDSSDLEVQAVPVYIQEKIKPQVIIEEVRSNNKKEPSEQFNLFADFNGIEFEDVIDFYRHEQNWTNRMILGDSLLVMTSLAEKEGLKGQVQMIYIDPPYGIKFGSNWQVSTRKHDVKDGSADDLTRQPEQIKAFRDTWELGIHSYLTYLRDRFVVARELLTESGSIFVQISDENVHLVRCLMDEVFGSENFVSLIQFRTASTKPTIYLSGVCDFIIWYAKDFLNLKFRELFTEKLDIPDYEKYLFNGKVISVGAARKDGITIEVENVFSLFHMPASVLQTKYEFVFDGKKLDPMNGWRLSENSLNRLAKIGRLTLSGNSLKFIKKLSDFPYERINATWIDLWAEQNKEYVVQTSTKVIERCLLMTTDPGDLVLDPTCGSGTTAYVSEQRGRRWITIDTSRVAIALARTRLMSAKYPYYLLADSPEGIRKETDVAGVIPPANMPKTNNDIKKGFVYRRVPHITLKAIANNPEIDVIYNKWQEKLEPIGDKLNQLLNQSYEEWQIPRDADSKWSAQAKELHNQWWEMKKQRQKEIDDSISRNADMEMLYDQPYEDNKRIRVTGPFTVESLSPHRVISTDEERPASESEAQEQRTVGQFEIMVIDNLRKAGVQNTRKNERLKFERLDTYAGAYIHAEGEYIENDQTKRVAVCIGPEHGTVDADLVKESAKEAVKGLGFDLLIVCGFAFDPHVSEEIKQYGKLIVLPTRMNPDLWMGDALLKKTGSGNLFMVFGEPDIDIDKQPDGKIVVTIKGVDIYDPTTGQIRSSSTDDIACWFIDTNYNGESFFVRHAYFCGSDEPYKSLQRALRSEINESAWSNLYSNVSYPFAPPETGKIAIKVINHYGDEVLKVY